jgi:hypothetical protein
VLCIFTEETPPAIVIKTKSSDVNHLLEVAALVVELCGPHYVRECFTGTQLYAATTQAISLKQFAERIARQGRDCRGNLTQSPES